MASVAIPAQPPQEPWIPPEEQLRRLAVPIAKGYVHVKRQALTPLADPMITQINETVTRSMLRCSLIENPREKVLPLFDLCVERLIPPIPLPPILTNWHKALDRLSMLPESIPPLPLYMPQIVDEKCPIRGQEQKPDGTHYKVADTHCLYLDPFPTINALEASVKAYGEAHSPENKNPLQFRGFWDAAREEHGNVQSNGPQWWPLSKDVLPGSRNKSFEVQTQMVEKLGVVEGFGAEPVVKYEVPSLKAVIATLFLHHVATGERLYPKRNAQSGGLYTYTRVKETTDDWLLMVGDFAPVGLDVLSHDFDDDDIGVAALRKF